MRTTIENIINNVQKLKGRDVKKVAHKYAGMMPFTTDFIKDAVIWLNARYACLASEKLTKKNPKFELVSSME